MGRGALKRAAGLLRQAASANKQANQQLETLLLFDINGQAAGRRLLSTAQRIAPAGAVIDGCGARPGSPGAWAAADAFLGPAVSSLARSGNAFAPFSTPAGSRQISLAALQPSDE